MEYQEKLQQLEQIIKGYGKMAVAFSGGVDSTFLLLYGHRILGDQIIAVTFRAPNFAPDEISYARQLCQKEHIRHMEIEFGDELFASFRHNPPNRCYICKKAIFSQLKETVSSQYPGFLVADGTNLDDVKD